MHDRHSFFGHALAFLLAFSGDEDAEEPTDVEPGRGFVARVARLVATGRTVYAGEMVGVVAGVLVDAGVARELG